MLLNADGVAASRILKERREAIAGRVTSLYFEAHPQPEQGWKGARQKCIEDNRYHLDYLCEALSLGKPALFSEYVAWAATLLRVLPNVPGEALALNLELLRTTLAAELEGAGGALASRYLDEARTRIEGVRLIPPVTSREPGRSTCWRATTWRPFCGETGTPPAA